MDVLDAARELNIRRARLVANLLKTQLSRSRSLWDLPNLWDAYEKNVEAYLKPVEALVQEQT